MFGFIKRTKIIIPFSVVVIGLAFSMNIYGADLQEPVDEIREQSGGWTFESGGWRYYNGEIPVGSGWHYLPEKNDGGVYRWFFFMKNGFLYNPPLSRENDLKEHLLKYTGRIFTGNRKLADYEKGSIEPGWYSFGLYGNDEHIPENECLYISGTGLGNYSICCFEDDRWKVIGKENDNTVFEAASNTDDQKWDIIKKGDDTFTFINMATGEALYDHDTGPDIDLGEKLVARPEYFGAKGDGISDDTFPIFYAINNSDIVLFGNTYNTTRTIDVKRDGVRLKGDGGQFVTHPDFRTFMVKSKGVTFDTLTFRGHYTKDESTANSAIFFITEKEDGDVVDYNATIQNCSFIETGQRGIHIHSARDSDKDFTPVSIASGITIRNCFFDTYKIGVCCSGPDNVIVENCTFRNGYYEHITFDWRSRNCKAVNNKFLSGERGIGAVGLDSAENIEIRGNDFNYTELFGVTMNNEAGKSKNIIISDNTFRYDGGFGGILFKERSQYGVAAENVSIINNTFDSKSTDPVVLNSAEGTVTFSGNKYMSKKPVVKETDATVIKDF